MNESDFFGYLASFLVFATFYMQKTIPLRIAAIASNVAFILYACSSSLTPILVLHSALLPLNLFRLAESWVIEPSRPESRARGASTPFADAPLIAGKATRADKKHPAS
jgi:hypothetical protein